jgi:cytochrome c-type biogenesis protein
MVPIYLANISGAAVLSSEARRWTVLFHSLSFVGGFSIVFIVLGASAGLIGVLFPTDVLRIIGGVILILFGVFLLAAIKIPWLNYEKRLNRTFSEGTGYARSALMGAAFSLGWTPCIGPILGGILTLAAASQTAWKGVYLLLVYSLGLGIPFIVVGLTLGYARPVLAWLQRWSIVISIVSGILLIIIGILILTGTLAILA